MKKGISLYLCILFLGVLTASVSALGSNNCFTVVKKRRRSVKAVEDKEVQLASHRESEKVTEGMDENKKSTGRRRSAPRKTSANGWDRMISGSLPQVSTS